MDFEKENFEDDSELSPLEDEELGGDADEIVETEEEEMVISEEPEEEAPAAKPAPKPAAKKAAKKKQRRKPVFPPRSDEDRSRERRVASFFVWRPLNLDQVAAWKLPVAALRRILFREELQETLRFLSVRERAIRIPAYAAGRGAHTQDAGWGTVALNALFGRPLLRREVPK